MIELLVIIAVIAVITAIILPVMSSVKAKSQQSVCFSNLRQLGLAVYAYGEDNDQQFPFAGDPEDLNTKVWLAQPDPSYAALVAKMQPLHVVLYPYTHSNTIWRCPSDKGLTNVDVCGNDVPLTASPTLYDSYGSSYSYDTMLTLQRASVSNTVGYDAFAPFAEHGASDIYLMADESGEWHGGGGADRRYDVLMVDGHVSVQTHDDLVDGCTMVFAQPQLPTPPSN